MSTISPAVVTTQPQYVIKRDGTRAEVRFDKITDRNATLCESKRCGRPLTYLRARLSAITQKIAQGAVCGMSTHDLDMLSARTCVAMTSHHQDYGALAARIYISDMHKRTPSDIMDMCRKVTRLSDEYRAIVARAEAEIMAHVDHDRDYLFDYFGIHTMLRSYVMRDSAGTAVERPQFAYMRVALTTTVCQPDFDGALAQPDVFAERLALAFQVYDLLSTHRIVHASPTMFNSGAKHQQLASCNLLAVDDDLATLLQVEKDAQMMSKWGAGIGINITPMRAAGQVIQSTGGVSTGIHRYIVKLEGAQLYVNQGGRRPGAYAVYLETFHADILTFLELGRLTGGCVPNAPDLKYAMWINDMLMEAFEEEETVRYMLSQGEYVDPARVATAGDWYLFSPDTAPNLDEVHGEEFRKLYTRYVEEKRYTQVVKSSLVLTEWFKTIAQRGTPYTLFKDHINAKSNLSHVRTIRSSNLCGEITIPSWHDEGKSDEAEYGVCNLGAVPLSTFVSGVWPNIVVDWVGIAEAAGVLVRNLDHTIDVSYYPEEANRRSSFRHRAIAVGTIGLADVLAKHRIGYGTAKARALDAALHAAVYFGAMLMSTKLGAELGNFDSFEGSASQRGLLQPDMWVRSGHLDPNWEAAIEATTGGFLTPTKWAELRASARVNLRNSYVTACMPTATSSQNVAQNECFEPYTANLYSRKTLAGEFPIIVRYLIDELVELGLWDDTMRRDLIENDGSVQNIARIPADIRRRYRTARELDQRVLTHHAAARNPFLSQTQSLNYYFSEAKLEDALSVLLLGWKLGLTTGSYYMHMQAAVGTAKTSVRRSNAAAPASQPVDIGCGGACSV